jgi:FkbM family methyltransferase
MSDDPTQITEPINRDTRFRIEMTVSCKDCEPIPKVMNAGQIATEHGERVQIMHNGLRVLAGGYYGDWMTEIISRLRGHHEPQEELVFHEVLKNLPLQATMIELGGFWSYYTLWFLQHDAAARRAIVVEPDPHHLAIGRANARLNDLPIEFLQASVGLESIPEHDFQCETSGRIRVPQVTITQLLDDHGIERLDLLHCDVQGAETDILRSCSELLAGRRVRFCFISTHSHHISGDPLTHQRCLALLKGAGAEILAEHDVQESFSGDGLIVAYFGASPLSWSAPRLSYNRYSTSLYRNPLFDFDEATRSKAT